MYCQHSSTPYESHLYIVCIHINSLRISWVAICGAHSTISTLTANNVRFECFPGDRNRNVQECVFPPQHICFVLTQQPLHNQTPFHCVYRSSTKLTDDHPTSINSISPQPSVSTRINAIQVGGKGGRVHETRGDMYASKTLSSPRICCTTYTQQRRKSNDVFMTQSYHSKYDFNIPKRV